MVFGALVFAAPSSVQAGSTPTCGGVPATIVGTAGDDTLSGTEDNDVIVGLGGDDLIRGGEGNDLVCGGTGDDSLYSGPSGVMPGREEVYGGSGNDKLFAGFVEEPISDTAWETAYLYGGRGDDVLHSARCECEANLIPGPGNDRVVVMHKSRWLVYVIYRFVHHGILVDLAAGYAQAAGRDLLTGWVLQVYGSAHDDILLGSARGNEALLGLNGSDTIRGREGNDILIGGRGADRLYGGRGRDNCQGGSRRDRLYGCEEP